jgi:hypothetical protein
VVNYENARADYVRERNQRREVLRKATARMLRRHQFKSVTVHFDGSGDDGAISHMEATKMDGTTTEDIPGEAREAFEESVYEELPGGWSDNDGSSGEVVIARNGDVNGRIGWNVTDVEYESIGEGLPDEGESE